MKNQLLLLAGLALTVSLNGQSKESLINNKDVLWLAEATYELKSDYKEKGFESQTDEYVSISGSKTKFLKTSFSDLMGYLFDESLKGNLKLGSVGPLGDQVYDTELTLNGLNKLMNKVDTVYVEDFETGELVEEIMHYTLSKEDFTLLASQQEWYYNHLTNELTTKVISASMAKQVYDEYTGEFRGNRKVYHLPFGKPQQLEAGKKKGMLYNPDITWARRMDIGGLMGEKGQFNIYENKIAGFSNSLKIMFGKELRRQLFDAAKAGTIKAYESEAMQKTLNAEAFINRIQHIETVIYEDIETMDMIEEDIVIETYGDDIGAIKVKQLWWFNTKEKELKCKVKGVGLLKDKYSETGEAAGYQELFWIKFAD